MASRKTLEEIIETRWPIKTRKLDKGKVPTAYMLNQNNFHELLPDPEIIEAVEEAFDLIETGHSTRKTTPWLNERAGIGITHQTLNNLYNRHRRPFLNRQTERATTNAVNGQGKMSKRVLKKRSLKRQFNKVSKEYQEILDKEKRAKLKKELAKNPKTQKIDLQVIEQSKEEPVTSPVNVVFKPNPGPQTSFLASNEREVLYGGAAGGGKSYAILADPMRYFNNKNFVGLLVRRTNDELRELKLKSQEIYPKAFKGAKWSERESSWKFPSGATLWMTYLEKDQDVQRYQGHAFSWIAFDELTQYPTPFAWNYLRSRLRSVDPTLPLFMRATANPGGPGHAWVKKMFVDPAPAGKPFWATDHETGEVMRYIDGHAKEGQPLFTRQFIPASLYDNPYLTQDGAYEQNLMSLPEAQRKRLLHGDWNVVAGAAFPEFNLINHTCEPFEIPREWNRFRSCDFGYSSHSAVLWYAVDPSLGTLYVYRELYVAKHTGYALGMKIVQIEHENNERLSYGVLDSSVWHQRGQLGPSIAEEILGTGARFRPSDRSAGSRIAGKNRLHELLKIDEGKNLPEIVIFDTCRQLITDLQTIPSDPKGGEDIDQSFVSDHTYDSLRYGIMSRPAPFNPFGSGATTHAYRPVNEQFGY